MSDIHVSMTAAQGVRLLIPAPLLTVSCPALDAPPDGKKFGSKYLVNHEVHFTCNPGFQLVGPSSVVCLANGTWTGERPHCRGMTLLPYLHRIEYAGQKGSSQRHCLILFFPVVCVSVCLFLPLCLYSLSLWIVAWL